MMKKILTTLLVISLMFIGAETARAVDTTPPSTPFYLSGSMLSTGVYLSWPASTDDTAVTGYIISRCDDICTPTGTYIDTGSTALSYYDTNTSPALIYSYRIRAYDAAGNISAYSSVRNAYDSDPPTIPVNFNVSASTATSITLSWDSSIDGGGVIGYYIYRCDGTCTPTEVYANTGNPTPTFTDTGLSVGETYSYRVRAYDARNNTSSGSSVVTYTVITPPNLNKKYKHNRGVGIIHRGKLILY